MLMTLRPFLLLLVLVACGEAVHVATFETVASAREDGHAARFVMSVAVQGQRFDLWGDVMLASDDEGVAPVWQHDYYQCLLYACGGQWFSAWVEVHPLSPGGPPGTYDLDICLAFQASQASQPTRWKHRMQCDLRTARQIEGGGFLLQIQPRPNKA